MIDLSIVLPTCNRAALLERAIDSVIAITGVNWELIVVDGASTDATPRLLERYRQNFGDRIYVHRESQRRGFVKAINEGIGLAQGRNVCWLNDDARPLPGALERASHQMDAAPGDVGLLAIFHRWHSPRNVAYRLSVNNVTYSLCHVRGTLYANFAFGRRETFELLGRLDERYAFCGADPDLSLKAWHAGFRVEPAWGVCFDHDEHEDDRRAADADRMAADNARLFQKWNLPPKNPRRNDFDPAKPCTLIGMNPAEATTASIAA
jgi:glycosyltransferase involved in cell wall biosynthesis